MAWITYGGPDGADALGLAGGSWFSFYSRLDLLPGVKVVACLPTDIYNHWRHRLQYIGQLEALVAVSVYYSLRGGVPYPGEVSHDVRERDVIHFVDNFGSMMDDGPHSSKGHPGTRMRIYHARASPTFSRRFSSRYASVRGSNMFDLR
eukprot:scaffold8011_cov146-Isochrysis_galbana.AAC.3